MKEMNGIESTERNERGDAYAPPPPIYINLHVSSVCSDHDVNVDGWREDVGTEWD